MLEIFILFQATRTIADLAEQKGENPRNWKIRVVVIWILVELLVAIIIGALTELPIIAGIIAIAAAYGSYQINKGILAKKPDRYEILSDVPDYIPAPPTDANTANNIDLRKDN